MRIASWFSLVLSLCLSLDVSAAGATSSAAASQSTSGATPNVLLVITDDQGYGDIGAHGNTKIRTPNLDELSKQSVRLTNFHVDPTCAETRSALMSGKYPMRVGVWHTVNGRSFLDAKALTLPQHLKNHGYRTGIFGKWHLGDNAPYQPWRRGFDESLILGGGGVGQLPDTWGNDYFDDTFLRNGKPEPGTGYCTDRFFSAASEFIKQRGDKPFFCYVATNAPHSPYRVDDSYSKPYLDAGVSQEMAKFYGMITNIDENVGKILKLLEEEKIADNTIVIFMTDNGTAAGVRPAKEQEGWQGFDAGMRGQKGTVYEGGHRVPCFVRWPAKFKGTHEVSKLTAHYDLFPTIAQWCSAPTPDDWKGDGRSLTTWIENGKDDQWSDRTLIVQSQRIDQPVKRRKFVVMDERWRMVGKELYDLTVDPKQEKDVAAENPEVIERLNKSYDSFWDDVVGSTKDYQRIALGEKSGEEVLLTAHDWHGEQPVAYQSQLLVEPNINGFWAVDIQKGGMYEFRLRTRPDNGDSLLNASRAEVNVGALNVYKAVPKGATEITLRMPLFAGPAKLETILEPEDENGSTRGAYFLYVKYLGESNAVPQQPIEATQSKGRGPYWSGEGVEAVEQKSPLFQPNDRVAFLGATLIERLQIRDELEALLSQMYAARDLRFRNVGWSGDDLSGRARAVFGGAEDGYQRRLKDLEAARPTVVLMNYGINESFDETLPLETVKQQANRLLEDLKQKGYRIVLLLPPDIEVAKRSANLATYNRRVVEIRSLLREVATARELKTIQLPAVAASMTDNGLHLHATGYSLYSREVARVLAAADGESVTLPWEDSIAPEKGQQEFGLSIAGTSSVKLGEKNWMLKGPVVEGTKWIWEETRDGAIAPGIVASPRAVIEASAEIQRQIKIADLADGNYELSIDGGKKVVATAQQWKDGVVVTGSGMERQAELLRLAIHKKNDLFFHQYRPQNETYLFLFRKHEQGNNAVDIEKFPPIIEEVEKEIVRLSRPLPHQWVLQRLP